MNTSQAGIFASSFEQAKRYRDWLPASEQGRWIITCNFREFRIYDLEFPRAEPEIILLENLESECQKLQILVNNNAKTPREIREQKLSEQAGRLIRKFYDSIKPRYTEPNSERSKQSLNILCTRLVFLLYSEDAGIFAKNAFHDFLLSHKNTARTSLLELFAVLNQPEDQRDPYLADDAIFENTLNDETREEGGMHYTSPENIHKVINPLFMSALNAEFTGILALTGKKLRDKLIAFQDKLSRLTFLDPACGSGNFLTETFILLRRLENRVIAELSKSQKGIAEGDFTPIKVSISQFYGIEINDFAVNVARTALYIAEHQMRQETEAIVEIHDEYLPLKHYANIIKQNAITYQWESLIKPEDLNYIWKSAGNIDYVACWYVKAFHFMKGSNVRAAFVSTNSINQGDNVSVLWKDLFAGGFNINFAYRSFIWENKAEKKAHVHCVILGFNVGEPDLTRHIYEVLDDGNYLFTRSEYLAFIAKEPKSQQYFHLWYGGEEFIHSSPRYCLYLGNCTPHEIHSMPECLKRVKAVRAYRLASKRALTLKLADTPARFGTETFPTGNYIVIPEISSEKRAYIPMGFLDASVMCSNRLKIIPDATLYHFGVLESLPHMGWVRRVSGRLEMRYSYSIGIDYNPYVWPFPTDKQRAKIEATAQMILDARAKYPDSSLDELYKDATMPPELRQAHRLNDMAVCGAYGFSPDMTEYEIVNELMRRYQALTEGEHKTS